MKTNDKDKSVTPKKNSSHTAKGVGRKQAKLNEYESQVLQSQVIEWMMNGLPRSEIVDKIQQHLPRDVEVSEVWALHFYQGVKQTIEEDTADETMTIVASHISLYEQIFDYFFTIGNAPGVNKALFQKEKLLGLHKTDVSIKINNQQNINLNKEVTYNVSQLTNEQQSRLAALLKKAVKNDSSTSSAPKSQT